MEEATASERYLAKLCRQSFLRLWSWPNVFRDQHFGTATIGKQVCDLLVVFDNHIFIFSDKYCEYPNSGDVTRDWARWFKRAILKSAEQVWGAERWLRNFPDRLFLDKFCKERFPITLPPTQTVVFHRIVVAHGSATRCMENFGGSGSLLINPSLIDKDHYDPSRALFAPFTIGSLSDQKAFVHVIDDFSLDILLTTLDTAPDLAKYFERRAAFLESGKLVMATGEEELLAYYLRQTDHKGEHHFHLPQDATAIMIAEGSWQSLLAHPQYIAKIEADKVSYAWDRLIEQFTKHLLEGTQYQIPEYQMTDPSIANQERGFRFLAREGRVRRRVLAKTLLELLELPPAYDRAARIVESRNQDDPFYVFVTFRRPPDHTYEEYRKARATLLWAYCLVTRLKFPEARYVVGIATDPRGSGDASSEDMAVLDGNIWNEELAADARAYQKDLELLTNVRKVNFHEPEYPNKHRGSLKGRNRNQKCPCGSGLKYKKCCGR